MKPWIKKVNTIQDFAIRIVTLHICICFNPLIVSLDSSGTCKKYCSNYCKILQVCMTIFLITKYCRVKIKILEGYVFEIMIFCNLLVIGIHLPIQPPKITITSTLRFQYNKFIRIIKSFKNFVQKQKKLETNSE